MEVISLEMFTIRPYKDNATVIFNEPGRDLWVDSNLLLIGRDIALLQCLAEGEKMVAYGDYLFYQLNWLKGFNLPREMRKKLLPMIELYLWETVRLTEGKRIEEVRFDAF